MKSTQKLLKLKRQLIAHLGAVKIGLETLAGASVTTGAGATLNSMTEGTKLNPYILTIAAGLAGLSLAARAVISHYMRVSVIENPLETDSEQEYQQPEPAEPKT